MSDLPLFLLILMNERSVGENVVPGLLEARIIIHNSELDLKQTLLTRCTTYSSFSCLIRHFIIVARKKLGFWVSMTLKSVSPLSFLSMVRS